MRVSLAGQAERDDKVGRKQRSADPPYKAGL